MDMREIPEVTSNSGIHRFSDVIISDRAGRKHLPIGDDGFATVIENSVFVDKSMLVADVINGGKVRLFCRPRRFGKTLALTMLRAFFEMPGRNDYRPYFEQLSIWDADGGYYRQHQGAYPVISLSLKGAKNPDWAMARAIIEANMAREYQQHAYLAESPQLVPDEQAYFARSSSTSITALAP